jgi:CHAT domain-containing protein
MSLWKVPDLETAEFMQLFYGNLFANQTITEAFHGAQTSMKMKYRNDPYKWAAWILVR